MAALISSFLVSVIKTHLKEYIDLSSIDINVFNDGIKFETTNPILILPNLNAKLKELASPFTIKAFHADKIQVYIYYESISAIKKVGVKTFGLKLVLKISDPAHRTSPTKQSSVESTPNCSRINESHEDIGSYLSKICEDESSTDTKNLDGTEILASQLESIIANIDLDAQDTTLFLHCPLSGTKDVAEIKLELDSFTFKSKEDAKDNNVSVTDIQRMLILKGMKMYLSEQSKNSHLNEPTLIASVHKKQEYVLVHKNDFPFVSLSRANINRVRIFLSPCQLNLITETVKSIKEALNLKDFSGKDHIFGNKVLKKEDYMIVENILINEHVLANNNVHLNKPQGWTQLNESTDSFKSFQSSQTTYTPSFSNNHFQNSEILPFKINVDAICFVLLQEKPINQKKIADRFFLENELCNLSHFSALAEYLEMQFDICPDSGCFSVMVSGRDLTVVEKLSTPESSVRVTNTLLQFNQATSNNFVLNLSLMKFMKVSLDLMPVNVEFDLTLVNRMYKMFSQSFCNHLTSLTTDYNDPSDTSLAFNITCPLLNFYLKIPVVDSTTTNQNWEEQNVHKEMFLLQFSKCSVEKKAANENYVIQAQEVLTSLLLENRDVVDLFKLKNLSHELQEKQFDWPRITINFNNTKPSVFNYVSSIEESFHPSLQYVNLATCDKLFEKISMFMESSQKEIENAYQPANKNQTNRFITETLANCAVNVDILAPIVHIWLPEKEVTKIVYDRLLNDLAFWEPYKPSYVAEANQSFFSCSSIMYDSIYEEDMTTSIFNSDLSMTRSQYGAPRLRPQMKAEHKMGLKLHITQCEASIKGFERVSTLMDDCSIFLVTGYENEINHSYFSLQLRKLTVLFDRRPILSAKKGKEDMLNVAVSTQINNSEEESASKEILVATGLSNCVFHYYDDPTAFKWIEELIEYVNVITNSPIPGYKPYTQKLNINFCLNKVALDYRPVDFKYKALVSLNSFSISSNLIRHQVLLENFEIFLSNKVDKAGISLCSDYVKLMEVLLLEFSFQSSNVAPYIDFIASNNSIDFWLCSDSLKAVVELLEHILLQSLSRTVPESKPEEIIEEFGTIPNVAALNLMMEAIEESKEEKTKPNAPIDTADMDFCYVDFQIKHDENVLEEPEIETFDENLEILPKQNYFFRPEVKPDPLKPPKNFPIPLYKILLKNFSLNFHLYGGEDFGDKAFETVPNKCEGGPGRQKDISMEFHFNKIKYQHEIYSPDCEKAFRQVLLIRSFEIQDKHKNSNINKFLYEYVSEELPRQTESNMLLLKVLHTRPEPTTSKATECSIYITIKPLRLNIDQTSFYFLNDFFDLTVKSSPTDSVNEPSSPDLSSSSPIQENTPSAPLDSSTQMFIRSFILSHDIPIKLDYNGKQEDNEQGYAALALNYLDLENTQLILKKKCYKRGILGIQRLFYTILKEWSDDIVKNQMHNVVLSLGKINYLVRALNGIFDFFVCPILQYQKDGTLIKGFHKGTRSLTENSICTLLTFICGLITGCHTILMRAFPASQYRYPNQMQLPAADFKEGINDCFSIFQTGAKNIIYRSNSNKGVAGAIGDVICAVPRMTLEGSKRACEGLRYQLEPKARQEQMEKWKNCGKS